MGIFGMGLMLGVLKRYLPISDSLVTLTYDGLCFGVLGYVILRRLRRPSRLPFTGIIPCSSYFAVMHYLLYLIPMLALSVVDCWAGDLW